MTSPLETKARALAEDLHSYYGKPGQDRTQAGTLKLLLAFSSEVERETLERAAKVECLFCRGGRPVKRSKTGNYYHEAAPGWKGDYRDGSHDCHATNIRSLSEPPAEPPEPKVEAPLRYGDLRGQESWGNLPSKAPEPKG